MGEMIERNGRFFEKRNLDEEKLTSQEAGLRARVARFDSLIDARTRNVIDGEAPPALPMEVNSGKGVTKLEKNITREAMLAIIRAELFDPILVAEDARRRVCALLSEGYELPERSISEEDTIDYDSFPRLLIHNQRMGQGFLFLGKEQ